MLFKSICFHCESEVDFVVEYPFAQCPNCGFTLYSDGDATNPHTTLHNVLPTSKSEDDGEEILLNWFSKNGISRGSAIILGSGSYYFPLWYIKTKDNSTYYEPAIATMFTSIKKIKPPLDNLELGYFELTRSKLLRKPEISSISVYNRLNLNKEDILLTSLIHIPVFYYEYSYEGKLYQILVEAFQGKVCADVYPPIKISEISSRVILYVIIAFLLMFVEGMLIKDIIHKFVAMGATGIIFYIILQKAMSK